MNVTACIHRVPDPDAHFRLAAGGTVELDGVPSMLDPIDSAALEVGVTLIEQQGGDLTVLTAGAPDHEDVLRIALARGAGRAVRVDAAPCDGREAAMLLAAVIAADGSPDLVLFGASSSDHGGGSTGAVVAHELALPLVQNVIAIDAVDAGAATVQRRRDGGYREVVRVKLPAVLTVERSIAASRFPTTAARLRAQRAPIELFEPSSAAAVTATATSPRYQMPPPRLYGIVSPEPQLDARERLRFLVQGGQTRRQTDNGPVTGTAEEVASAIAEFLRERGFVTTAVTAN